MRIWIVAETILRVISEVNLPEVFHTISSIFISLWILYKLLVLVRIVINKTLTQTMVWIHIEGILSLSVRVVMLLSWVTASMTIRVLICVLLLAESKVTIRQIIWL